MVIFKFRNLKTGQATPIPPGEFTVGRADDAYIHVDDGSVSRNHAKISNVDDSLFVEDLGSSNGTAAHGTFITGRMKVAFGDMIHIGSVPFRVDPEVVGEASAAPSAGTRVVNRAYLRQDTERVTLSAEKPRVVETLSPQQLSAPEVNRLTDADAEDLNAITIREPEAVPAARLPLIRPGGTPLPKEGAAQPARPAPTPQPLAPPKPQSQPLPPRQARPSPTTPAAPAPVPPTPEDDLPEPEQPSPEAPPAGINWGWLVLTFLAGMGAGLLLGLYFARLFFEMGGKASALP